MTLSADTRAALRDTAPAATAMIPLGMAFGVLVTQAGLAWWWTPVINGLVFGGSLEFLLLGMLTAGVPLASVAVTTLLVQGRHVFYCLTFPLHRVQGRGGRLFARYALIDEAYALTTGPDAQHWPSRRILAMQVLLLGYWVGGGVVGALLGSLVPAGIDGLDFALTGLFVVLAVDAFRAHPDRVVVALALGCAGLALLVAPGEMLVVAMTLYVACLLVRSARMGRAVVRA